MRNVCIGFVLIFLAGCNTVEELDWEEVEFRTHEEIEAEHEEQSGASDNDQMVDEAREEMLRVEDREQISDVVELVQFTEPDGGDGSSEEDSEEEELSPVEIVHENLSVVVQPRRVDFNGGAVRYNFLEDQVYQLFTAPLNLTEIRLEPGERLTGAPASGDSSNFMIERSESSRDGVVVEHVFVKALAPGRNTTLSLQTDRRSYIFRVRSFERTHMPLVTFRYPLQEMRDFERQSEERRAEEIRFSGPVTSLDFNYSIVPHSHNRPAWMPSLVFNDGVQTFIQFASARRASYAPVFFSIEGGERVLVNYRVVGTYYVVDRVIDRAELVLDINAGNIVSIRRHD